MFCFMEGISGSFALWKVFLGVCYLCQRIFGVVLRYPTPLISVYSYAKSTPWDFVPLKQGASRVVELCKGYFWVEFSMQTSILFLVTSNQLKKDLKEARKYNTTYGKFLRVRCNI